MSSRVLLCLGAMLALAAGESPSIHRASIWGGPERDRFSDCAFTSDGRLLVAGTFAGELPQGLPVRSLDGRGYVGGGLLVHHPRTDQPVEVVTLGVPVDGVRVDAAGNVFLWSAWNHGDTLFKADPDLTGVAWVVGGVGHGWDLSPDGHAWCVRKRTITRYDPEGQVAASFDCPVGSPRDIAYDPVNDLVVAVGSHAQSNLFWPWLVAMRPDGSEAYQRWNWGKKEAWAGGTADSHLNRVEASRGKWLLSGHSDGNPTSFERLPTDVHQRLPKSVPRVPLGNADPASSRPVAWFGMMDAAAGEMLAWGRLFAPVTVKRPSKDNPDRLKTLAGTTKILDMALDDEGRLYLVGFARGRLRWTADSPHREVGPSTWRGTWGNPEAPKDPFLIVTSPDYTALEYCGSFAQGESDLYQGEFAGVAISPAGFVCAAGMMARPGTPLGERLRRHNEKRPQWARGPPEHYWDEAHADLPPGAVAYQHRPLQAAWGGQTEGYLVLLGGEVTEDPAAVLRVYLDRRSPAARELLAELRAAEVFGPATVALEETIAAGDLAPALARELERAVADVHALGARRLEGAAALERPDPAGAEAGYARVADLWAGLPAGEAAAARRAALAEDASFQDALRAQRAWHDVVDLRDALGAPAEGQRRSFVDVAWHRANRRPLGALTHALVDLVDEHPDTAFAERARALAAELEIPLTRDEKAALRILQRILGQEARLQDVRGARASARDEAYARRNARALAAIRRGYLELGKRYPDSPYAMRAAAIAERYDLVDPP